MPSPLTGLFVDLLDALVLLGTCLMAGSLWRWTEASRPGNQLISEHEKRKGLHSGSAEAEGPGTSGGSPRTQPGVATKDAVQVAPAADAGHRPTPPRGSTVPPALAPVEPAPPPRTPEERLLDLWNELRPGSGSRAEVTRRLEAELRARVLDAAFPLVGVLLGERAPEPGRVLLLPWLKDTSYGDVSEVFDSEPPGAGKYKPLLQVLVPARLAESLFESSHAKWRLRDLGAERGVVTVEVDA